MIDPRIPLGVQPLQIESPMQQAGQLMQLQGMQQQQQLYGMKMAEAQRQAAEQGAIREAFKASGGDLMKSADALQAQGLYEPALKLRSSIAEQAKARAEAEKQRVEMTKARFELQKNVMSTGFSDPSDQGIARMGGVLRDAGFPEESVQAMFADLTAEPDLKRRQQKIMGFVRTPESLIDLYKPQFETVDLGDRKVVRDKNLMSNPDAAAPMAVNMNPGQAQAARDAAAGRAVSMRGQDLSRMTARERLAWEQANPTLTPVETADGVFQVPNRGGPARPVIGPDGRPLSGKPPTEGQSNSALFANRAIEADKAIQALAAGGTTLPGQIKAAAESVPLVGGALGAAINAAPEYLGGPSPEQQQVEQAQRDFLNAVLRKESGAVIGASEFDSGKRQYFPQVGDSPAVIEQKAQARRAAIAGLTQASGTALGRVQATQQAITPPAAPQAAPVSPPPAVVPQEPQNTPQQVSGQIGGPPQGARYQQPQFVEQRVDKMPMPSAVPPGTEIDLPNGQTLVSDGKAWRPKR